MADEPQVEPDLVQRCGILLIGPDHTSGSLSPYLRQLATALRSEGMVVERLSSYALPYDPRAQRFWSIDRVMEFATALLDQVDLNAYDLLSVHFGNLELEQLLPVLWGDRDHAPAIYHVHTLAPTLLKDHVPSRTLHQAVVEGVGSMDGYVYFGRYAHRALACRHLHIPALVAWWPSTIPAGADPYATADLAAAIHRPADVPLVSVYGFASPWKNAQTLIHAGKSLEHPARIVLAGPFWDDPEQAGVHLEAGATQLGPNVSLAVIPAYLDPRARLALLQATSLGVFPYQDHFSFQGSGVIGDYLGHGVPVIAADVANMAEVVGPSGLLVPPDDSAALLQALSRVLGDHRILTTLRAHARSRMARFTMTEHARRCAIFYRTVAERPSRIVE